MLYHIHHYLLAVLLFSSVLCICVTAVQQALVFHCHHALWYLTAAHYSGSGPSEYIQGNSQQNVHLLEGITMC